MNYKQAVDYIHSKEIFGSVLGLSRMQKLMEHLDNPQNKLKFIHIAGTNGKGSAAAMTASVLKEAGYKVGLNISPYVIDFKERFQINGEMISKAALAAATNEVKNAADEMAKRGEGESTEFEIVTAIALYWFCKEQCDLVVLEVGLGGRLDATNIIQSLLVSFVMNISLDHTAQLGGRLAEIAAEKAAIIKENSVAVCYPKQEKAAKLVIASRAKTQNTALVTPQLNQLFVREMTLNGSRFLYNKEEYFISLVGEHQVLNAVTVLEGLFALRKIGYDISNEAIKSGLKNAKNPARFEVLQTEPLVIIDGAHNENGAMALAQTLKALEIKDITGICGMLKDKDCERIVSALSKSFTQVYTVDVENPRTLTAQRLSALFTKANSRAKSAGSLKKAFALGLKSGGICVAGSLYLAAQARPLLIELLKKH